MARKQEVLSLCRTCKRFIERRRGPHGGLQGICELSGPDRKMFYKYGKTRPVGCRKKCLRYIQEDLEGGKDGKGAGENRT